MKFHVLACSIALLPAFAPAAEYLLTFEAEVTNINASGNITVPVTLGERLTGTVRLRYDAGGELVNGTATNATSAFGLAFEFLGTGGRTVLTDGLRTSPEAGTLESALFKDEDRDQVILSRSPSQGAKWFLLWDDLQGTSLNGLGVLFDPRAAGWDDASFTIYDSVGESPYYTARANILTAQIAPVPEPATLLGLGAAIAVVARRRRATKQP